MKTRLVDLLFHLVLSCYLHLLTCIFLQDDDDEDPAQPRTHSSAVTPNVSPTASVDKVCFFAFSRFYF